MNEIDTEWNEGLDQEENAAGFRITDDEQAEWALGKILDERKERDRMLDLIEAEQSKLTAKRMKAEETYQHRTAILRSALDAYMLTVKTRDTKTRSTYQLLSGRLVRKRGSYKYERNAPALCAWLKSSGREDLVSVEETPRWADLKRQTKVEGDVLVIKDTGEIVDGVTVSIGEDTFDVEED